MSRITETVLEVNLNHLAHNLSVIRSKIHENTKVLAVVKAFAYGSEASAIALKLQELDVDYFAVAYTKEGVALRDAGIVKPIVVLHPQLTCFKTIIDRCLEPSLYNYRTLKGFAAIALQLNQKEYPIHIKFNTGLNRLGFSLKDVSEIADYLNPLDTIKPLSIFSHLAATDDLNEIEFTRKQIKIFETISDEFNLSSKVKPFKHVLNTSGIFNFPEAEFDMVRAGISLYGFANDSKYNSELKPVASLKSIISQIHEVKKGESVGYNRAFIAEKDIQTATIPIGHADGISRQFGNQIGYVTINNKKAYILGNVCMDMIMVDVTEIDCYEGDPVIFFDEHTSASKIAGEINTISYELLTAISQRVIRRIIE